MPTRSEVENWDTEHLDAAADHWSKTATVWEDCFTQYAHQVANPGGAPWEGDAAEAAQQRAHSDRLIVVGLADKLHDASAIARKGAMQLKEACRLVMRSVHSAEDDGFTVGEDFSVTDDRVFSRVAAAARQAKAEAHADAIRAAVADLVAADARIAGEITTAAAGLGTDHFAESGGPADGKPAADGQKKPEEFDWIPDPNNRTFMATGAIVDGTTDAIREAAVKAMKEGAKTGPGKASPRLVKFLDDVKVAGRSMKGISRVGGLMTAVMVVPAAISDMGEGDSWRKAFGKETGGAVAGLGSGALVGAVVGSFIPIPGVGTMVGMAAGSYIGYLASEGLDTHWEALADTVGSAVHSVGSAANAVGSTIGNAARSVASVFSFG